MRRTSTSAASAICVLLICLFAASCADRAPTTTTPGPLSRDDITLTTTIPAEYGDLIAVTTTEIYPNWAQLWFQKADKTIVTVFVNYSQGAMEENALVIPRS